MSLPSARRGLLATKRGYTKQTTDTLPAMTADNAPAGHFASWSVDGSGAFAAFDKKNSTVGFDVTFGAYTASGWVMRQTPAAIRVWRFGIRARQGTTSQSPKAFILQGSNNGSSFVPLVSVAGQVGWSELEERYFDVPESNRNAYLYHRVSIYSNANSDTEGFTAFNEIMLLQETQ